MARKKQFPPDVAMLDTEQQLLLNVIFHGPFLFIYYEGRVEAVTPHVPEHVVVAGNWLDEKPCHSGTYFLTGIKTQQDTFDPSSQKKSETHIIFKAKDIGINIEQGPYYRFFLPLPWREEALAVATMDPKRIFVGEHAKKITAKSFGTAHVLSYKIGADDTPQLEDLQWRPEPSPYGIEDEHGLVIKYDYARNLHIYAEAAFAPDHNHAHRDLNLMVAMLPRLKLGLAQRFPDPKYDPKFQDPSDNPDFGIIREEQGGLRGLPPRHRPLRPPLVCDAPSMVVTGAKDPVP